MRVPGAMAERCGTPARYTSSVPGPARRYAPPCQSGTASLNTRCSESQCWVCPGQRTARSSGAKAGHAPPAQTVGGVASPGAPGEPLLHAREGRGVLVSAGSACACKHEGPGHVLQASGLPDDVGTLRVSFSRETTPDQVARATEVMIDVLGQL